MQQARVDCWQKVKKITAKDFIVIDESGVNLAMVRRKARSEK
ncbi:hypothetical protein [[Leptolyngbya] sp. PCC 7376]|nr:hypothetical protein [[Leptolyngbya] sp. PCC 7376]